MHVETEGQYQKTFLGHCMPYFEAESLIDLQLSD